MKPKQQQMNKVQNFDIFFRCEQPESMQEIDLRIFLNIALTINTVLILNLWVVKPFRNSGLSGIDHESNVYLSPYDTLAACAGCHSNFGKLQRRQDAAPPAITVLSAGEAMIENEGFVNRGLNILHFRWPFFFFLVLLMHKAAALQSRIQNVSDGCGKKNLFIDWWVTLSMWLILQPLLVTLQGPASPSRSLCSICLCLSQSDTLLSPEPRILLDLCMGQQRSLSRVSLFLTNQDHR